MSVSFTIEIEQEGDGRWIGEVLEIPGALVYAETADAARLKAQALALRILADRLEEDEVTQMSDIHFSAS